MLKNIFPKFYDFYIDLLYKIQQSQDLGVDEIHEVGSRKSGKSLNTEMFFILACNLFNPLTKKPIRCDTFAFRYESQDKVRLFNDFISALERLEKFNKINLDCRITKNKLYFPKTKSTIWIDGLTTKNQNRVKKTGLHHSSAEYIFKFLEERSEFPNNDIQDVNEAVRGIGSGYRMLTICCSNPRTLSNEYIWWCNSHLKFNEAYLRDKHYQFLKKNINLSSSVNYRAWFIYNNWRVIKEHLTQDEIIGIQKSWEISYQRGL